LLTGGKKAREHRCGRAIEDIGIVEPGREVGKNAKERHGATGETEPPKFQRLRRTPRAEPTPPEYVGVDHRRALVLVTQRLLDSPDEVNPVLALWRHILNNLGRHSGDNG
jgi:hypothetical protein